MNKRFYVYGLKYPDGTPFYVGKGKGDRWNEHEREAKSNRPAISAYNPQKVNVIRKLWENGEEVIKEKIITNITEEHAFQVEKELITKYGMRSTGGLLVNLTYGGEGTSGYKFTLKQHKKLLEIAKRKIQERARKRKCAFIDGYARIIKKTEDKITEIEKRIVALGFADLLAYLATRIQKGTRAEKEARRNAKEIEQNMDAVKALLHFALQGIWGVPNKQEAELRARELSEYGIKSNQLSLDEANRMEDEISQMYFGNTPMTRPEVLGETFAKGGMHISRMEEIVRKELRDRTNSIRREPSTKTEILEYLRREQESGEIYGETLSKQLYELNMKKEAEEARERELEWKKESLDSVISFVSGNM